MHYDIIGDIHGYAAPLIGLLRALGYERVHGSYQNPERTAIFLGDFIDYGPGSKEVLEIVRAMVENDAALAVLGNHEFNAVCFHTPDGAGGHLRSQKNPKNLRQHEATLASFGSELPALMDYISWFKELPLWLELPGIRVAHACWDARAIATLQSTPMMASLGPLTGEVLGGAQAEAMKLLCKGHEVPVEGLSYRDKSGHNRNELRVAWWRDARDKTCCQMAVKDKHRIPEYPFPENLWPKYQGYRSSEPLLFIGHYSLEIRPEPLLPNLVCIDLGVTGGRGLACYRWSGEEHAMPAAFCVDHGEYGSDSRGRRSIIPSVDDASSMSDTPL